MTPAAFQTLQKGDTIQDMRTGKAYVVANPYDDSTRALDVYEIHSIYVERASEFKKVSWPE